MYCPYCKAILNGSPIFCPVCENNVGAIYLPSENHCSECQKVIPADAVFCPHCGQSGKEDTNVEFVPEQSGYLSLKVNGKIAEEAFCRMCPDKFSVGEDIVQCQTCSSYFHKKCWHENGGCNQLSCKGQTKPCPNCSQPIKITALKCRHCGSYLDTSIMSEPVPIGSAPGAVAALVCSLVGLIILGIVFGIIAIVQGSKALRKIEENPAYTGKGMATAGIVIGIIDLLFVVIFWAYRLGH